MKWNSIALALAVLMASCSESNHSRKPDVRQEKPRLNYPLATVRKGGVATTVKLPAQLAAYQEVNIFPKVNGYVQSVLVDIGSKVTKGTLLLTLEAPELQQSVLEAKEKYAKAFADYTIDKEHYERLLVAARTAGAVSPLDLSTLKARMDADKAVCSAEKANWQMQQTMQGYLQVRAPFSGVITERNIHPGILVSAVDKGKPVLELKQTDKLRLQADIPETIAATLKDKDAVSFFVSSFPGKKMIGMISRKADNVNLRYRSERIEVDVDNKEGLLTPGMYADIILDAKGDSNGFSVPRSAVVISTERKYVLKYRNGKIIKVDVFTGNEAPDSIQVYGDLKDGDQVIARANDEIAEN